MMERALVVLSGGQDSTTCLYWALNRFGAGHVEAVTFDYGQRHRIELDCAARVAVRAGVAQTVLPINTFAALGGNALTDANIGVRNGVDAKTGLPNTFVPGRNLIFLTFAAALAHPRGIRHLVTGVAQTDYSGYPDCRQTTLQTLERALCLGMEYELTIHTPLMFQSKADTVRLARDLGALPALADTQTCYNGIQPPCGECPACVLRAKGFAEAGIPDPLVERFRAKPLTAPESSLF
ncbi:MAG: 7-cyano-7-deazaguanine synthase QueC [Candidatus Competibacteraceae bacterium]|nr:7-cyano-7-deazaguanine synthase QueC [Candidatus Competibacteraceae bacterium]